MIRPIQRDYRFPGGRVYKLYTTLADRPHLLIAGATGSGKSVTVNGIMYSLLARHSPNTVRFILIDPKKVELSQYAKLPHVMQYASEPTDIIHALEFALNETERRFRTMQKLGIREWTQAHLYIIIDELADLMIAQKKEALPILQRIAAIGRAARVHLFACSQNILAQTIPTTLKCNIPAVLGLRTATAQQSRFLISAPGCEMLPDPKRTGRGAGYLRDGADLERHDIYKYPDEEIQKLIDWWTSPDCIVKGA